MTLYTLLPHTLKKSVKTFALALFIVYLLISSVAIKSANSISLMSAYYKPSMTARSLRFQFLEILYVQPAKLQKKVFSIILRFP